MVCCLLCERNRRLIKSSGNDYRDVRIIENEVVALPLEVSETSLSFVE